MSVSGPYPSRRASQSLIADSFPRNRLTAPLAVQGVAFQMGAAVGVITCGAVLQSAGGWSLFTGGFIAGLRPWQLASFLIGSPGLLAALLVPLITDPRARPATAGRVKSEQRASASVLPFLRQNRRFLLCMLGSMGLATMVLSNVTNWAPEYVRRTFHADPLTTAATTGGIALVAALIGQLGSAIVADAMSSRGYTGASLRVLRWPLMLMVPLTIVTYSAQTQNGFLLGFFFLALGVMPASALYSTALQLTVPAAVRARIAAMSVVVVSWVGFAIGPGVVGALSQWVFGEANLNMALMSSTSVAAAGALALLVLAMKSMRELIANKRTDGDIYDAR